MAKAAHGWLTVTETGTKTCVLETGSELWALMNSVADRL